MGEDRSHDQLSEILVSSYEAAIAQLHAGRLLTPHLSSLEQGHVIALGKAARSMAQTVAERGLALSGVVVCPEGGADIGPIKVFKGDHPLPGTDSLEAGHAVLEYAKSLPRGSRVIGLLSGGASALVESLEHGWTLETFRDETRRIMARGAGIAELNAFRQTASRIKGGGLASCLAGCQTTVYVLSDVEDSRLEVVGSGPFWTGFAGFPHIIIGDAALAADTLAKELASRGFSVGRQPWIGGEARTEGAAFARRALLLAPGEAAVASGEPVVTVRGCGKGGRAQEFALAASEIIQGRNEIAILAAGTDGRDGPTEAAGAIATGSSWDLLAGTDLENSDSHTWAVRTQAMLPQRLTDTNVNDLFAAIRLPEV